MGIIPRRGRAVKVKDVIDGAPRLTRAWIAENIDTTHMKPGEAVNNGVKSPIGKGAAEEVERILQSPQFRP